MTVTQLCESFYTINQRYDGTSARQRLTEAELKEEERRAQEASEKGASVWNQVKHPAISRVLGCLTAYSLLKVTLPEGLDVYPNRQARLKKGMYPDGPRSNWRHF